MQNVLNPKSQHLLQDWRCPGSCKRELYEGDVCHAGTCEYNRNDPMYQKEAKEVVKPHP